ncbi:hypothetical protein ACFU7D_04635 [Nocardioides sp. NPDC057577]|uniref:hypothetical protein n=1 Tax=unclassified Nocardioides TaxID=2615069 RepID=UPI00364EFDD0
MTSERPEEPRPTRSRWTAGRVIAVVAGSVLLVISFGFIAGGAALTVASILRDSDGYLMTDVVAISTPGHAITSESISVETGPGVDVPERLIGDTRLVVTSADERPLFVGIGRSEDIAAYLDGVRHSTIDGFDGRTPTYDTASGAAPATLPADAGIWVASTTGTGPRTLTWDVESGEWTIVVMNADGSAPVTAVAAVGATVPALGTAIGVLLGVGGVLLLVALALLIGGLLSASRAEPASDRQPVRSAPGR